MKEEREKDKKLEIDLRRSTVSVTNQNLKTMVTRSDDGTSRIQDNNTSQGAGVLGLFVFMLGAIFYLNKPSANPVKLI